MLNNTNYGVIEAMQALTMLTFSWENRARVKRGHSHNVSFNPQADDFLIDLLPFKDHPLFLCASEEMKRKILSCGWVIYNQKTISIETQIVNPVCIDILSDQIPGLTDFVSKQIASQTMVDESYHVLLVVNAIKMTSKMRQLNLKMPTFNLIKQMQYLQNNYSYSWQKILIQLATAIVSEIFISDYLKLLSENEHVQPINRLTVKAHRDDELAHGNIFKQIMLCVYAHLNKRERNFFQSILMKPMIWFADNEYAVWQSVLKQIGFKHAFRMLSDCQQANLPCSTYVDYSALISLAEEIGLVNP